MSRRAAHLLTLEDVQTFAEVLREQLSSEGVPGTVIDEWELCFVEAATNAIEHGGAEIDCGVEVRSEHDGDALVLVLMDRCHPIPKLSLDRAHLPFTAPESIDDLQERGRGLQLLYTLTETMSYQAGPPNTLTLERRISSQLPVDADSEHAPLQ